jgi:hypothetical protein
LNKKDLFKLYQKLYFHEMDVKEKLVVKSQISFAIVVTAFTVISYMLRMLDYDSNCYAVAFFVVFLSFATVLLTISLWFLIRSFYWRSYKGVPSPEKIDQYRVELNEHVDALIVYNKDNPDYHQEIYNADEVMESYLYQGFKVCSTHNTEINDGRSGYARDGFMWILSALVPLVMASSIFILSDLDVSSPRKALLIKDSGIAIQLKVLSKEFEDLKTKTMGL